MFYKIMPYGKWPMMTIFWLKTACRGYMLKFSSKDQRPCIFRPKPLLDFPLQKNNVWFHTLRHLENSCTFASRQDGRWAGNGDIWIIVQGVKKCLYHYKVTACPCLVAKAGLPFKIWRRGLSTILTFPLNV